MRIARLAACLAALAILVVQHHPDACRRRARGRALRRVRLFVRRRVAGSRGAARARAMQGRAVQGGDELPPRLRGGGDRCRQCLRTAWLGAGGDARARAEHREPAVPPFRRAQLHDPRLGVRREGVSDSLLRRYSRDCRSFRQSAASTEFSLSVQWVPWSSVSRVLCGRRAAFVACLFRNSGPEAGVSRPTEMTPGGKHV